MNQQETAILQPLKELIEDAGTGYLTDMIETIMDCWIDYNDRLRENGESVREDMGAVHLQLKLLRDCLRKISKLQ